MAVGRKEDVGGARYIVESVDRMSILLRQMLERASRIKETTDIEPAITNSDLGDILQSVEEFVVEDPRRTRQFPVVETAVRDIFNELLVSIPYPHDSRMDQV